jgi:hydroxyjasmonate sulfotransferase
MAPEAHSTPVPAGSVPFEDFKVGLPAAARPEEQAREEADKDDQLLSTLPSKTAGYTTLYCYKGFWLSEVFVRGAVLLEQRFDPRPDDVIVASYPKCGTTWLIALTVATMVRRAHAPGAANHPLRRLSPHQCVPFLETLFAEDSQATVLDALPSPRLMNTHLPLAFIPQAVPTPTGGGRKGCKVVYICRDPKDMVVSRWHYLRRVLPGLPFQDLFDAACDGAISYGPFWDHFLGYWGASVTSPDNVLFVRYEELLRDPVETVRKLARFVGQPFSPAEEETGVVRGVVELCSLENLKSMEAANKTGYMNPHLKIPREALFRKGIVGDWKRHMTTEMARRMDEIVADKFHHTGLTFQ